MTQQHGESRIKWSSWEMKLDQAKKGGIVPRIQINIQKVTPGILTADELNRLNSKLPMIGKMTEKLFWGVVKETLKKESEGTAEQFLEGLFEQIVEAANYWMLYEDAAEKGRPPGTTLLCSECDTSFPGLEEALTHSGETKHRFQRGITDER